MKAIIFSVHVKCPFGASTVHLKENMGKTPVDAGDTEIHVISAPRCFL